MNRFMTATEARKNFYAVIDEAGHPGLAVAITHEGTPKVVVMSFEEYESWRETLEVDAELDDNDRRYLQEVIMERKAGKPLKDTVSLEEAKKSLSL